MEHHIKVPPPMDKVTIANMCASELAELTLSPGNYIRKPFRLWSGNDERMASYTKEARKKILVENEASAVHLGVKGSSTSRLNGPLRGILDARLGGKT